MPVQAFYLPTPAGQRLGLFHAAQGTERRGRVLYLHPFAEEMNKSRRMAALQARALSAAGFAVLQLDLGGCGDSAGDFADAHWDGWIDDVLHGAHWLRSQAFAGPLWLWGLRAGCLLGLQAAQRMPEPCHHLWWQPPASGAVVLQQILRLRAAADLLGGQARNLVHNLRGQLQQGQAVEVAGYTLSPALARGLEQAVCHPPESHHGLVRVEWLEVTLQQPARLATLPAPLDAAWQRCGIRLARQAVHGPAFWQSSEVELAPALLAATTHALCAPPARRIAPQAPPRASRVPLRP